MLCVYKLVNLGTFKKKKSVVYKNETTMLIVVLYIIIVVFASITRMTHEYQY